MYCNPGATVSFATPAAAASVMPMEFPLNAQTEPLWLVLGGFAIFAAGQAAKRIAPTWTDIAGATETATTRATRVNPWTYQGKHRLVMA